MTLAATHALLPGDDRGEPLDYSGGTKSRPIRAEVVRAWRVRAQRAEEKVARRDATIALLSERVEIPLCAADLAVQARIPLTHARRVWRVLTEQT